MTALLLVGATGLVGRSVLDLALADPRVTRIVAPTRRALAADPRVENPVVRFDELPAKEPWWTVDGVICTLGTTMRAAGSREAFRAVDLEIPLAVATLAGRHGVGAFALTSSAGADPGSRVFYLRTKGEVEQAVIGCGFRSLTIVRPSAIGGERSPRRPLESLATHVLRAVGPVLPARYRVVDAGRIARVLLDAAIAAPSGVHFVESDAI